MTDRVSHRVEADVTADVDKVYTISRGHIDEDFYIQAIKDEHDWVCSCGEEFSDSEEVKNHLRMTESG